MSDDEQFMDGDPVPEQEEVVDADQSADDEETIEDSTEVVTKPKIEPQKIEHEIPMHLQTTGPTVGAGALQWEDPRDKLTEEGNRKAEEILTEARERREQEKKAKQKMIDRTYKGTRFDPRLGICATCLWFGQHHYCLKKLGRTGHCYCDDHKHKVEI